MTVLPSFLTRISFPIRELDLEFCPSCPNFDSFIIFALSDFNKFLNFSDSHENDAYVHVQVVNRSRNSSIYITSWTCVPLYIPIQAFLSIFQFSFSFFFPNLISDAVILSLPMVSFLMFFHLSFVVPTGADFQIPLWVPEIWFLLRIRIDSRIYTRIEQSIIVKTKIFFKKSPNFSEKLSNVPVKTVRFSCKNRKFFFKNRQIFFKKSQNFPE